MKIRITVTPLEWILWPLVERWWTEPVWDAIAHDRGQLQPKGAVMVRRIYIGPIRIHRDEQ